jgi:hypothetical protein
VIGSKDGKAIISLLLASEYGMCIALFRSMIIKPNVMILKVASKL